MRKALVVGIDFYRNTSSLNGCVHDAYSVESVLERDYNGTPNFGVFMMTGLNQDKMVTKRDLKDKVVELFSDDSDVSLFYFSGHGYIESNGGYLITSECERGDEGFSLNELMAIANSSKAKNKIIILDCCHSGDVGVNHDYSSNVSVLSEGMTILAASTADQYAVEDNGEGLYTRLLVDAMNGSASNLTGDVTPGSIYAHIDQALGPWKQRPIFKTNVKNFVSLRKVEPPIAINDIRALITLFPDYKEEFKLDPSFEPDSPNPDTSNNAKFAILQRCEGVNLVVPVGEDHMYFAAMKSKSCKLTPLGIHYWNLAKKNLI